MAHVTVLVIPMRLPGCMDAQAVEGRFKKVLKSRVALAEHQPARLPYPELRRSIRRDHREVGGADPCVDGIAIGVVETLGRRGALVDRREVQWQVDVVVRRVQICTAARPRGATSESLPVAKVGAQKVRRRIPRVRGRRRSVELRIRHQAPETFVVLEVLVRLNAVPDRLQVGDLVGGFVEGISTLLNGEEHLLVVGGLVAEHGHSVASGHVFGIEQLLQHLVELDAETVPQLVLVEIRVKALRPLAHTVEFVRTVGEILGQVVRLRVEVVQELVD